jgi:hypothetical protein
MNINENKHNSKSLEKEQKAKLTRKSMNKEPLKTQKLKFADHTCHISILHSNHSNTVPRDRRYK